MSQCENNKICEKPFGTPELTCNPRNLEEPPATGLIKLIGIKENIWLFRALSTRDSDDIKGIERNYMLTRGRFMTLENNSPRKAINEVFNAIRATLNKKTSENGYRQYSYTRSFATALMKFAEDKNDTKNCGIGIGCFPVNVFEVKENDDKRRVVSIQKIIEEKLKEQNPKMPIISGFSIDVSKLDRPHFQSYLENCNNISDMKVKRAAPYDTIDKEIVSTWSFGRYMQYGNGTSFFIEDKKIISKLKFITILFLYFQKHRNCLSEVARQEVDNYIESYWRDRFSTLDASHKSNMKDFLEHKDNVKYEYVALEHLWIDLCSSKNCSKGIKGAKRSQNCIQYKPEAFCYEQSINLPYLVGKIQKEFRPMLSLMRRYCIEQKGEISKIIKILYQ